VDHHDCAGAEACDLYAIDASPYESVMVGQFAVHGRRDESEVHGSMGGTMCKGTWLHLGFSRDGFHWTRTEPRKPVVADAGALRYQQPVAGNFVIVGDEIYYYYGGVSKCTFCNVNDSHSMCNGTPCHIAGNANGPIRSCGSMLITKKDAAAEEVTALAVFRRDGFASLGPPRLAVSSGGIRSNHSVLAAKASMTTRVLRFTRNANSLMVNVDASRGHLRVWVLLPDGSEMPPFTSDASVVLRTNSTAAVVSWRMVPPDAFAQLRTRQFRLAFELEHAHLYSFWVAHNAAPRYSNGHYTSGPGVPTDVPAS